jgi:hypothetical protein
MSELEETKSILNKAVSDFHKSFYKPELMSQAVKDLEQVVKTIKKLMK